VAKTIAKVDIDDRALAAFHEVADFGDRARALHLQQRATWALAARGYASLAEVQLRSFSLNGSTIRVQFNPGRLRSSSAKVDAQSIQERPCFLCLENLPDEQRSVPYGDGYMLLVNPFPIFPEHFTIPSLNHEPQRIENALIAFLDLARDLGPRYTAFYNGPRCGASAPDHLHFQAGTSGFMPMDGEFSRLRDAVGESVETRDGVRATLLEEIPCRCVGLESGDRDALEVECARLLAILGEMAGDGEEPMVNILVRYEDGWRVLVIPRARHRPSFYSAEGDGILLSPASVDLGGVCIVPREEDFQRIEEDQIATMFDEVCLSRADFQRLRDHYG
jgi:ATP adenylyltransferase/5',5'''-P-1,P-4-tetraphosphate phosphorylase II